MSSNSQEAERDLSSLSFEEALNLLTKTVEALEAGGLTLEEATRTFEQGMKLARLCSEMLAATELKLNWIQTSYGEQMRMLANDATREQEDAP